MKFKIEIDDANGIWSDVRDADGRILTFEKEEEARARLAELYPVQVKMEEFAGGKHTRVVRVFRTDQEWKEGNPPA